jgi:large conductance mechanosensitive channel
MASKGFREFLLRGNVIDLAVAVTVGTAFTAVVLAVTKSLLQPLVNVFLGGGVSGGQVHWLGQTFDFGAVINALVSFAIIAAAIYFLVVVPVRRLAKPQPPAVDEETRLLEQIRDLLAQQH